MPDRDEPREDQYQTVARVLKEQFRYGLSPAEAVDRLGVEKAGIPTGEWAAIRGVAHSTVSGNVSRARQKINASRLDAETWKDNGNVVVGVSDSEGERHELSFAKETQVMNADADARLELVYESHTAIHGFYIDEHGDEYEATLWYDGGPSNSFEEFDHFDEWGSPEAKADTILWERD